MSYIIIKEKEHFVILDEARRQTISGTHSASEAIEEAQKRLGQAGGCIQLGSGTFPLIRPVEIKNKIRICGEGKSTRVSVPKENKAGIGFVIRKSKGVEIESLLVSAKDNSAARVGIVIDGGGNCKIRSVSVACFSQYGIHLSNSCYLCQVSDSSLFGNEVANLYMEKCIEGEYGDYIPNTLSNLMIFGGGKGIELNNVVVLNIIGCSCYHNSGAAYHFHSWSNSITLTGCRSFQITGCAVIAEKANELNFNGNIFCWHTLEGIRLKDCRWGTLTGNEIIDSGSHNPSGKNLTTPLETVKVPKLYSGIVLADVRGFHIGGNAIFNWDVAPRMKHGLVEESDCRSNIISNNTINYFEEDPIISRGIGSLESGNTFEPTVHLEANPQKVLQSFQIEKTKELIKELS